MNAHERRLAEGILYTDMYQLTMGQLYYRMGLQDEVVQFEHFFRSYPNYGMHKAGYCVNAGLEWILNWMLTTRVVDEEINYLKGLTGATGERLFQDDFLEWLRKNGTFESLSLRAIPEGRVVHPSVPLTVVQGPIVMAQLLETALLNNLNYQTLIATKAARIHESARGQLMLEFGMRRAQERGAVAGARAALIGGADFTSNVGISAVLGYPPKGTHAHSMVQLFIALGEGELAAFRAYAELYPDDCLLLVDTINTLESGVPNAIRVFEELKRKGHKPVGIRLDSGDLAYLSIQASKMLDEAGFPEASIVLSNQLDELVIWQIMTQIQQECGRYGIEPEHVISRLVFGVGTRLITSEGDSALDGVYKLVSIRREGSWVPAIKISESPEKTLNPGHKQAWRIYDQRGKATVDLLSLETEDPRQMSSIYLQHPTDHTKHRVLPAGAITRIEPLLVNVVEQGKLVYDLPTIEQMRAVRKVDMDCLDLGVKRLVNPHAYHVSLTEGLWNLKDELVRSGGNGHAG
jgi:nicotinate phosphoribosyltransferase